MTQEVLAGPRGMGTVPGYTREVRHGQRTGVHTGGMDMVPGCSWEVALQGPVSGLLGWRRQGGRCEERAHLLPS